ncbi:FMN-dependent oxidoreductase (nitrilotriacetate monooxygenase family) [Paraburkholderia sp. BL6665CI2N2]|uniref:LLM class flavin-dependent oxidoreductase n=1 Tax=Paraburkholderia sp. BL6665CI2N2 TaxID=1938806 RepID=UPI00106463D3|nr:LLM class flavin-dependent oxidoreductase [Paraburkholderia sp. BL6665CI2N2]TDY22086.1 FMN-dependent oxidoreductase (nitrilotriacetate monooxygenase family) [Paraburkholderia sp. BL6665CI2N2]
MNRESMILGAFFFNPQGDHRMSWRHPRAPGEEIFDLQYYRDVAALAESACLDALFIADHVAMWDTFESNVAHYANARLEPITLLSALSAVTRDLGLISTLSASFSEPYNVARMFASLDHLSHGRAAWNVVTSSMDEEAMNFGRDSTLEHAHRYERATEYVEVVKALWDSWEDGAVLLDRKSGLFADPGKVHRVEHSGRHFSVRGPLNVPRPPQGHPIIVQAGSSGDGKNLAARHADMHFSMCRSIEEGLAYRKDLNERLRQYGRTQESLKILPGIQPVLAASQAEAEEKRELLESLVPERMGVDLVSSWCQVDLSKMPLDGPLPDLPDEETYDGQRSNLARLKSFKEHNMTIREVARLLTNSGAAPVVAGTAVQIADFMEEWFKAGLCDGFNLMFPVLVEDMFDFVHGVVPELQRRGLAQTSYRPGTLRDKLGLIRSPNSLAVRF